SYAQRGELRVEPSTISKDVVVADLDKDYQDVTTVMVTNGARRVIQLAYRQRVVGKPAVWRYGTFNSNGSGSYVISSAPARSPSVNLSPGQSASFAVVLEPRGQAGDGRIEIEFFDRNAPNSVLGRAVVTSEILERKNPRTAAPSGSNLGRSSSAVPTSVRLYPNPARERFFVEAPPGVKIGRVEVSNTLGSRLRKYDRPSGKEGYDVEELPDGLYLISIYDDKGKKLKTLRLLHRQFGA
ncbi:MAG: T9SS type A sorting domain-containing protein, partial [Bacteroidota bacterium]